MTINNKNTILVVDDDTAHRTMLKTLLSGWGYLIEEADDGSTAILKVEEPVRTSVSGTSTPSRANMV